MNYEQNRPSLFSIAVAMVALLLLDSTVTDNNENWRALGFQASSNSVAPTRCCYRTSRLQYFTSLSSHNSSREEENDILFQIGDSAADTTGLAYEFYANLRIRQARSSLMEEETKQKDGGYTEEEARGRNIEPFGRRREVSGGVDINTPLGKGRKENKFSGRRGELDSTGTPSAGLFSRHSGYVYSFPVERVGGPPMSQRQQSPRFGGSMEQLMRYEFNILASEKAILVQLALVVVLLGVSAFIGVTNGITDEMDRFGGSVIEEISEFNRFSESLESMLPGRTDSATNEAAKAAVESAEVIRGTVGQSVWI